MSCTGLTVPSAFDTQVTETSLVRSDSSASNCSSSSSPSSLIGATTISSPICSREQLPGHDVGVVLEARDQHLIAGSDARPDETLRHQIDAFGGVAREHDLARRPRH